jgi:hypothetical protein
VTGKTGQRVAYIAPGLVIHPAVAHKTPSVLPGAPEALRHLRDARFQIVILANAPGWLIQDLSVGASGQAQLPAIIPHGSWLLTDDEHACAERRPGLKTILVGPKPGSSRRPTAMCDQRTRDLFSAVLEVLAQQAMA